MNRRGFLKGAASTSVVLCLGGQEVLALPEPKVVESRWETTDSGNDLMEVFETRITGYTTIKDAFNRLIEAEEMALEDDARGEIIGYDESDENINGDRHVERWQAFFVEYSNPYISTQRAYAHAANLLYEFRWEFIHSGDSDAYRVFRSVMNRATNAYQPEPMMKLLPTQEEFEEVGTYKQVS